jgi:hypothetical protein
VVSENFYKTLEEVDEDACIEDSTRGPSEAPIIKSPHKPRQEGQRGMQTQLRGTCRQISGTRRMAEVKGRMRKESETKKNTMGTSEDTEQTPSRGGRSTKRRDV